LSATTYLSLIFAFGFLVSAIVVLGLLLASATFTKIGKD